MNQQIYNSLIDAIAIANLNLNEAKKNLANFLLKDRNERMLSGRLTINDITSVNDNDKIYLCIEGIKNTLTPKTIKKQMLNILYEMNNSGLLNYSLSRIINNGGDIITALSNYTSTIK